MRHLDLFSGIGGFALAAQWVWGEEYENVGFVDFDPYCQALLKLRFPNSNIHGDIKTYKGIQGSADLITGGFPCQPFSAAGKRRGTEDERYLWKEMLRIIREVVPEWVIGENVAGLTSWGNSLVFDEVLADLENEGYAVGAVMVPAVAVNAPHRRDRIWIVAQNAKRCRQQHGEQKEQRGVGYKRNAGTEDGIGVRPESDATDTQSRKTRWLQQSDAQRHAGTEGKQDNPDAECEGRTRSSGEYVGQFGQHRGDGQHKRWDWDTNWTEVAAEFCGVPYGLSHWIHPFIRRRRINHGTTSEKYSAEDLRLLRERVSQDEAWQELGGLLKVEEKEVLLSFLRELQEATETPNSILTEGERASEGLLREMWDSYEARSTPRRRANREQLARKLTDVLPQLPYETALEVAEIWGCVRFAQKVYESPEANADGLKLSKPRHRRERLKAIGNSIVPQIAYQIMSAIKQTEKTSGEGGTITQNPPKGGFTDAWQKNQR